MKYAVGQVVVYTYVVSDMVACGSVGTVRSSLTSLLVVDFEHEGSIAVSLRRVSPYQKPIDLTGVKV